MSSYIYYFSFFSLCPKDINLFFKWISVRSSIFSASCCQSHASHLDVNTQLHGLSAEVLGLRQSSCPCDWWIGFWGRWRLPGRGLITGVVWLIAESRATRLDLSTPAGLCQRNKTDWWSMCYAFGGMSGPPITPGCAFRALGTNHILSRDSSWGTLVVSVMGF